MGLERSGKDDTNSRMYGKFAVSPERQACLETDGAVQGDKKSQPLFSLLHFSLGSVLYGFFFGCVFALVRIATGNLAYTVVMHLIFNAINVLLSYASFEHIPQWVIITFIILGGVGFILLGFTFFSKNRVKISENGGLRLHRLVTKEGYVTMMVCVAVMGMLLIV